MVLVVVAAFAISGCGDGEPGEASGPDGSGGGDTGMTSGEDGPGQERGRAVRLSIRVSDGRGSARAAEIACGAGPPRATGYLSGAAEEACRQARRLGPWLATEPDEDRICTQVYGGPQEASIQGSVGGRRIDRRLGRANGCQIADWARAAALLEPVRGAEQNRNGPG